MSANIFARISRSLFMSICLGIDVRITYSMHTLGGFKNDCHFLYLDLAPSIVSMISLSYLTSVISIVRHGWHCEVSIFRTKVMACRPSDRYSPFDIRQKSKEMTSKSNTLTNFDKST